MTETYAIIYLLVSFVLVMVLIGRRAGSRKRFFVSLGQPDQAHRDFVNKLRAVGLTEVVSPHECDYIVAFCPVASRVGTDVAEALSRVPADKPTILVVMHHTFNPHYVVADSRRLVSNPNVLTVDTLFYDGRFLTCGLNAAAWDQVMKNLGVSLLQMWLWRTCYSLMWMCSSRAFRWALGAVLLFGLWYNRSFVFGVAGGSK